MMNSFGRNLFYCARVSIFKKPLFISSNRLTFNLCQYTTTKNSSSATNINSGETNSQHIANLWFSPADTTTPFLSLPLPKAPKTTFKITKNKPISVLLSQITEEDTSIQHVAIYEVGEDRKKTRLARSTLAQDCLTIAYKNGNFLLELNEKTFEVQIPTLEERARPIQQKLDSLNQELAPLEERMKVLDEKAHQSAVRYTWLGLTTLCIQWGVMARLTWWEYSWDVMEPISYFLGAGTGILGYIFYVITQKEYSYETLHGVTFSNRRLKLYQKNNFDVVKLMELRQKKKSLIEQLDELAEHYKDK